MSLSVSSNANKVIGKIRVIANDFHETVQEGLKHSSTALKGTTLALNAVALPVGAMFLVSTIKQIQPTAQNLCSGLLQNENIANKVYIIADLALQLVDVVNNMIATALTIIKLALDLIPKDIIENAQKAFTPLNDHILPNFNTFAEAFGKVSDVISCVMMAHVASKIIRQFVAIAEHHFVAKKEYFGDDRLDFWLTRKVVLLKDAGLSTTQIAKIEEFRGRVKRQLFLRNRLLNTHVNNAAREMSDMIKNQIWKKMGENILNLTGKVASFSSRFFFGASFMTAGAGTAVGCGLVGASVAAQIGNLVLREFNARALQANIDRIDDLV